MDPYRLKITAEWFRNTVFEEGKITPPVNQKQFRLPPAITAARSLENTPKNLWVSRESIFLKQAKLLASYEDDYDDPSFASVTRYYPTYQSLTDQELRAYFSWRTKLRRGRLQETSLTFVFLYIYELINQIGAGDPLDGYRMLVDFRDAYLKIDPAILPYVNRWLLDYAVYYDLDPALLASLPALVLDQHISVLEDIQRQEPAAIMRAVKALSGKWLEHSKFYAACPEDMDAVAVRVLRRMSDHYAARCKKSFLDQYYGPRRQGEIRLFDSAVFCDPLKKRSAVYTLTPSWVYTCENGLWYVEKRVHVPGTKANLNALMKTIDGLMREASGFGHPIQPPACTKWVERIIRQEIQAQLAEKEAAEKKKIHIDFTQLAKIRQDAAATREKLIVEEDAPEPPPPPPPAAEPAGLEAQALDPAEYRLLQCLLYGGSLDWIRAEGHMLSVLADGVNSKLYDAFQDSVMDDAPQLVEDYIDDLKEMIRP